jgi:hypothetical protein
MADITDPLDAVLVLVDQDRQAKAERAARCEKANDRLANAWYPKLTKLIPEINQRLSNYWLQIEQPTLHLNPAVLTVTGIDPNRYAGGGRSHPPLKCKVTGEGSISCHTGHDSFKPVTLDIGNDVLEAELRKLLALYVKACLLPGHAAPVE